MLAFAYHGLHGAIAIIALVVIIGLRIFMVYSRRRRRGGGRGGPGRRL